LVVIDRCSAETTPLDTECCRPKGDPMATTICPTTSFSESPTEITGTACEMRTTAMSVSGSVPTSVAS